MLLVERHAHFLNKGESLRIEPGTRHMAATRDGVVILELFDGDTRDDTYYTDPTIPERSRRKTIIRGVSL